LLSKNFVRWDRYKCLELKNEICHHPNKLEILSEELRNEEHSEDTIIEKFINTTNSIAKDWSITSSTEIRKTMFRMSHKIYCLQKVKKHIKYKQIRCYWSVCGSNEFAKIVDSYNRLYESIHKKCKEFRKKKEEYLYWIKVGCSFSS